MGNLRSHAAYEKEKQSGACCQQKDKRSSQFHIPL
jgi:hypothetical protein